MDAAVTPAVIASVVLILLILLVSSRKARKLDAGNPSGLYRPKDFVRLLEIVLLLAFCAAAFVTIGRIVDAVVGIALMGLLLLGWIPLQFWQSARLLTDDIGIAYIRPSGRILQMRWQEIQKIDVAFGGITLRDGDKEMRIPTWFSGFDRIREIIRQHVSDSAQNNS